MPSKGIYSEYLDAHVSFDDLTKERKKQLARVAEARSRDVLVYAADARKHRPPHADVQIVYEDLLAFNDQLSVLNGKRCDVILETTGGLAEVAENMVTLLRHQFEEVGFIIPGQAMSAGTIMVMSGGEILMEPASSLGPIDAQITWQGKVFSAHAFLEGLKKIQAEAEKAKSLNRAYIPILQNISPGEIQACENAQAFSRRLVADWLRQYKFRQWRTHSTSGKRVTDDEKEARAGEIAEALCDHGRWLTHGRSIKMQDLREMGLRITDYSEKDQLCDAIRRYHVLLQMTFNTSIYKVFETPTSQIVRYLVIGQQQPGPPRPGQPGVCEVDIECEKCHTKTKLQANIGTQQPARKGLTPFPADNRFVCPGCGAEHLLEDLRRDLEGQMKLPIVQ